MPHHAFDGDQSFNVKTVTRGKLVKSSARPYRSHKYPACARCHKRRSRCTIDNPGESCLLCRLSKVPCSAASTSGGIQTARTGFVHKSVLSNVNLDEDAQVLGPVVSRDTQILESIVSDIDGGYPESGKKASIPVYRSGAVSRRPSPPSLHQSRESTLQFFHLIDPYLDRLIEHYFDELHPCLPMMDEQDIWTRLSRRNSLPSLFLASLVAYTSFYWNTSPSLPRTARPDQDTAWGVVLLKMKDSSQRGDMFAIMAAALNVAGRPSKDTVSNTCQNSIATALSHSIGLNHNCDEWNISRTERNVRKKLWWTALIHDRWFNFARGTPPYINSQHYNVPLPTIAMLIEGRETSEKHVKAAETFIHFCRLTEIVGDVLPLIYHVRSKDDNFAPEQTLQAQSQLDQWLINTPLWMSFSVFNERPIVPGFVNLQLSYLAVRMLLRRIAWHESTLHNKVADDLGLTECLDSAEAVAEFLDSLCQADIAGFWLPYHAQHFTSATTLLLRCALQANRPPLRHKAMMAATKLVNCLKTAFANHQWDLAEAVLPQTESILLKIQNALPKVQKQAFPQPERIQARQTIVPLVDPHLVEDDAIQYDTFDFGSDTALVDMFPELFAEFTDNAFFECQTDSIVNQP